MLRDLRLPESFALVLAVALLASHVTGFSSGPPLSACQSMFPAGHLVPAQAPPGPYEISVNTTSYQPGDVIEVTTNSSEMFRGMMLQARPACGGEALGTFSLMRDDTDLQLLPCNNNSQSAVAHRMTMDTTRKTVYWTAPVNASGHLVFQGTIVQFGPLFWTDVRSALIEDPSAPALNCPNNGVGTQSSLSYVVHLLCFVYIFNFVK